MNHLKPTLQLFAFALLVATMLLSVWATLLAWAPRIAEVLSRVEHLNELALAVALATGVAYVLKTIFG